MQGPRWSTEELLPTISGGREDPQKSRQNLHPSRYEAPRNFSAISCAGHCGLYHAKLQVTVAWLTAKGCASFSYLKAPRIFVGLLQPVRNPLAKWIFSLVCAAAAEGSQLIPGKRLHLLFLERGRLFLGLDPAWSKVIFAFELEVVLCSAWPASCAESFSELTTCKVVVQTSLLFNV